MEVNNDDWKIETGDRWYNLTRQCEMRYHHEYICGSDGKDYHVDLLKCVQESEYGKRVNLQLSHEWRCFIWERQGLQTSTFFIVSKLRIDPMTRE